jgi:hypothetical protein
METLDERTRRRERVRISAARARAGKRLPIYVRGGTKGELTSRTQLIRSKSMRQRRLKRLRSAQ